MGYHKVTEKKTKKLFTSNIMKKTKLKVFALVSGESLTNLNMFCCFFFIIVFIL